LEEVPNGLPTGRDVVNLSPCGRYLEEVLLSESPPNRHDLALVLSGGGARAAYQVGVLSAIAERAPHLDISILCGVSAGAINTVTLAAHPGTFGAKVRALRAEWLRLTADQVYHVRVGGLLSALFRWAGQQILRRDRPILRGFMNMNPLRLFMSGRVDLRGISGNIRAGRLRAVTLSATCYQPSETVTFVQGADDVEMWARAQRRAVQARLTWDHVLASAAIPILFPAVRIGDRYYGDGSVRQQAPLAPAVHLGASRILAIGMRPDDDARYDVPTMPEYPSAAQVMGMLFHSIFLDALETDAERLERLNDVLRELPPGHRSPGGMRAIKLLLLRPSADLGAAARPHFRRLPPVIRSVVRAMGGQQAGAADFVSYLLFEPAYTSEIMELGYQDACRQWTTIAEFLGVDPGEPEGCGTTGRRSGGRRFSAEFRRGRSSRG